MKLVKFFAAIIAAASMFVACETADDTKKGGEVIIQEFVNVYVNISETDWAKCGVWAWDLEDGTNYTGGAWPGQELTQKETIDGVEYYVWTECPKELVGTEIGFIVNNFIGEGDDKRQTADIKLLVKDGVKVSVSANDDGGYVITIDGEEFIVEEPDLNNIIFEDETYGVIGDFNGWAEDVIMQLVDGWAVATIEIGYVLDEDGNATDNVAGKFKVRIAGGWDYSFGYDATEEAPLAPVNGTVFTTSFNGMDNDVVVEEAGSYKVEFQIVEDEEENNVGKMKITKLAADAE